MSANFKYKNGGWLFTDQYGKELLFAGQNYEHRINSVPVGKSAPGAGKVFYVDSRSWGSGSDVNGGLNPDLPLATIEQAYALAVSGRHDYIVCLDGYDNDAATITIAKTGLHFIGLDGANHRAPFVWLKVAGTGAAAVFTIKGGDAANVEIAGFTLGADTSHPCITTAAGSSTNLSYAHIHHCSFGATGDVGFVAQDGITGYTNGLGLDGILVENCYFGYELTRDGIRFIQFYDGMIRDCIFEMSAYMGIRQITGGATRSNPDIINNKFKQKIPALDKGSSIYITDGGGAFIDGNVTAENADGACDNDPYFDSSTGTADTSLNAWGVNWEGYAVAVPATS